MSGDAEFCTNRAGAAELAAHLARCDAGFVPPLSARVDLQAYAQKMIAKAMRFEAWREGELIGLVAAYCNDPDKRAAFITSVSVLPVWQGQGIAGRLVGHCLDHIRLLGYARVELEVDHRSPAAVALYQKHGFVTTRTSGATLIMTLALGK